MFDREQFREEIKAQLKGVPRDLCVAFAVRAAMRVLPLLAKKKAEDADAFWFWEPKDRARHLLAVYRAYSGTSQFVLDKDFDPANIRDTAYAANAAASAAYNTYAAYAAYTAVSYAYVDADASASTAYVYAIDTNLIKEINEDLLLLNKISAKALLNMPLWSEAMSDVWQKSLADLKKDALSLSAGFEVWLDWYEDRLQGRLLDIDLLNDWNHVPLEIVEQGAAKVNAYLASLLQKDIIQPLNRVRAIFIGHGEAGKTSLIKVLHHEAVVKGIEAMTPGIEIREWQVPNTEIKAHLWDFGGQVVFHSTHKFFLRSSCVYIVVINARADIDSSEQAEYWLDHVKVFGGSAPVLLVGNKADEAEIHLQMHGLSQKYHNIKGFYTLSCTHAKTTHRDQFNIFKQALTEQLQVVGLHQMMFTRAQANVLNELRQTSPDHAFLSEARFNEICDQHGIAHEGELNREWLVDIFDKLGVMLHFEDLRTFHNAFMLNPRWLTHGVYALMNAKQARLSEPDIVKILKSAKVQDEYKHLLIYEPEQCLFISKAMQRFKLCYPLSNGELIVPALLSDELPQYPPEIKQEDILRFEFAFSGFLPRNLIGEFMVSRYEEIKQGFQSQRGAVFVSKSLQAQALVEADYHRRLLVMLVYGRDRKEYLTVLYDEMRKVFGDLALDYLEWVDLPTSACIDDVRFEPNRKIEKAQYRQLLACAKKGQSVYITGSGWSYDIGKVLGDIVPKAKLSELGIYIEKFINGDINKTMTTINQNLSHNTIHGSVVAAENIDNCFNSLQESKADDEIKTLLEQLLSEIKSLNDKVPALQAAKVESIADETADLIAETNREAPRKRRYGVILEGIKEAAQALGEVAEPIRSVVEQLAPLLSA